MTFPDEDEINPADEFPVTAPLRTEYDEAAPPLVTEPVSFPIF